MELQIHPGRYEINFETKRKTFIPVESPKKASHYRLTSPTGETLTTVDSEYLAELALTLTKTEGERILKKATEATNVSGITYVGKQVHVWIGFEEVIDLHCSTEDSAKLLWEFSRMYHQVPEHYC